jgi:cytochrome d ubiquinol oxidase subunit I
VAVLISTAWLVGGIAAYYLIKGRVREFARRTLSLSLGVVAVLLPLQLDLGDHTAGYVITYQPAKLEALEGNWTSTNTGYNVLVIPDMSQQRNKAVITVPKLGSYIAKDLSGNTPTPGLLLTPEADRPNMWYVFWGFRVMFYTSLLMFAAALMGIVLRLRKKLYSARWFHKLLVWMTPAGVVAIIAGWVTAETGRQPFVVYGHLRTSDAVSHLAPGSLVFSLAGFVCIYLALLTAWIVYVVRSVRRGPELQDGSDEPAPPQAGLASVGSTTEGA